MREVVGREEMKFPQKQLYSYNIQDDDEIHVELKTSIVVPSVVWSRITQNLKIILIVIKTEKFYQQNLSQVCIYRQI